MRNDEVRCNLSIGDVTEDTSVRRNLEEIGSKSKRYMEIRVTRISEIEDLSRASRSNQTNVWSVC